MPEVRRRSPRDCVGVLIPVYYHLYLSRRFGVGFNCLKHVHYLPHRSFQIGSSRASSVNLGL